MHRTLLADNRAASVFHLFAVKIWTDCCGQPRIMLCQKKEQSKRAKLESRKVEAGQEGNTPEHNDNTVIILATFYICGNFGVW